MWRFQTNTVVSCSGANLFLPELPFMFIQFSISFSLHDPFAIRLTPTSNYTSMRAQGDGEPGEEPPSGGAGGLVVSSAIE